MAICDSIKTCAHVNMWQTSDTVARSKWAETIAYLLCIVLSGGFFFFCVCVGFFCVCVCSFVVVVVL